MLEINACIWASKLFIFFKLTVCIYSRAFEKRFAFNFASACLIRWVEDDGSKLVRNKLETSFRPNRNF